MEMLKASPSALLSGHRFPNLGLPMRRAGRMVSREEKGADP
jgi:hypothetical protein